ncbi:MAG: phosphoenolpyruvate synthase regulatory protein [Proteobacteria bacterium]|nr:phosphoenolpyruvate synthase regulatory protein [Pseudomonadota bacterium]
MTRTVFFVSDSTALTAEMLGHSLLTQFSGNHFHEMTIPFVNTPERADEAAKTIREQSANDDRRPIVISTLIDPALRLHERIPEALHLDLFDTFIDTLEHELEQKASHRAGAAHAITDINEYMDRMEAVNFTMNHDDGVHPRDLAEADIILLGVSRSGKTPTCLYMALQFGVKAANYPLTEEDFAIQGLPKILQPWRKKLFGLTIDPERLAQIRRERAPNSRYATPENCRFEVEESEALMRHNSIPHLDTTTLSVEELATTILHRTGLKRHGFS